MRTLVRVVLTGVVASAMAYPAVAPARASSPAEASSANAFAGTWKGRLMKQPALDLHLSDSGGVVTGKAVFYVISPETAGPLPRKVEAPLVESKLDGGVLRFGVKRQEDGGITRMEMRLRPGGEAELKTIAASLGAERAPKEDATMILKKEH
jgi:hypothetical protein